MRLIYPIIFLLLQIQGAYIKPLQQRDSILIADQLQYGFVLEDVKGGTGIALPDYSRVFNDTLVLVRNWQIDTLKYVKKTDTYDIDCNIVISPFEEGTYSLPELIAVKEEKDTLIFDPLRIEVTTIPVDTATFVVHDIKGQMRYPLTFKEVVPWIFGFLALAAAIWGAIVFIRRKAAEKAGDVRKDPAYIVALRNLDKYRGDKFWAPEKQKTFYSGITDTLREYISDRFDIDACEMTTAEIFSSLRGNPDLPDDLYQKTKDMFELADFVKFAKHTAGDEENAEAIPLAVQFVMTTHTEPEQEP